MSWLSEGNPLLQPSSYIGYPPFLKVFPTFPLFQPFVLFPSLINPLFYSLKEFSARNTFQLKRHFR